MPEIVPWLLFWNVVLWGGVGVYVLGEHIGRRLYILVKM